MGGFAGKAPPLQQLEREPAAFPANFSDGSQVDSCLGAVLLATRGFRCRWGREYFEAGLWLVLLLSQPQEPHRPLYPASSLLAQVGLVLLEFHTETHKG